MRLLEAAVRTCIIASLGNQLQTAVTEYFGINLKQKNIRDLIHCLDQRHQFLTDNEEQRTLRDFQNVSRGTSMNLQTFLMGWKSHLEKALVTDYVPASDLADQLQKRAALSTTDYSRLTTKIRKHELETTHYREHFSEISKS